MRPLVNAVAKRTILLTAMFVFAIAVSSATAQGRIGTGHFSAGGGHFVGRTPTTHFNSVPRAQVDGRRGHFVAPRSRIIVRPGFRDPFFWGFYPYWGWGYPYAYGAYPYDLTSAGNVKTEVTPKQTEVYVDGYYAGVANDFDDAINRLRTSSGGRSIALRLEGYRTVTEDIYVRPGSTYKLKETMERLAPGEVSAPVPLPALPTVRSDGTTPAPYGGSAPER
jgi:PEGA domain